MKHIFFIILTFLSSLTIAGQFNPYIGSLKEGDGSGEVSEFGLIGKIEENILAHYSFIVFKHNGDRYKGKDISVSLSMGNKLKVYTGLGGFFAHLKNCSISPITRKRECTSDYAIGLYPEVGLLLSIQKVKIGVYGRYYKTFDGETNEYKMHGFQLGYDY